MNTNPSVTSFPCMKTKLSKIAGKSTIEHPSHIGVLPDTFGIIFVICYLSEFESISKFTGL